MYTVKITMSTRYNDSECDGIVKQKKKRDGGKRNQDTIGKKLTV